MRIFRIIIFFVFALVIVSCDEDESAEELRNTSFTIFLEHTAGTCNNTNLNFQFLLSHSSLGLQETHTLAPGEVLNATKLPFREGDVLNIKLFVASSENPLHEANIPMIFRDYTEAQLTSLDNEIRIKYCHLDELGNITWTFFI